MMLVLDQVFFEQARDALLASDLFEPGEIDLVMARRNVPARLQNQAVLALWETRRFDSAEIASVIGTHESAVVRLVQASRDVILQLYREGPGAPAREARP